MLHCTTRGNMDQCSCLTVLLTVIFIGVSGQEHNSEAVPWYLSHNGYDTFICGLSVSTACKTLDWLLGRFYNTSYSLNQTLSLLTDSSLIINEELLKRHTWIQNLSAVASTIPFMNKTDVTVNFTDVTLLDSSWTILGLNLIMKNANLENTKFTLQHRLAKHEVRVVNIFNSTWKHLNVHEGFNIHVADCNINGQNRVQETLINIRNCALNIMNSSFYNFGKWNSGPALINSVNGRVEIQDVRCSDNYASNGLIQILNGSELLVENSVFENNGHLALSSSVISVKYHSSTIITNCIFTGNNALYGACLFSDLNTTIVVNESNFANNKAIKGGAIFCQNAISNVQKEKNVFSNFLKVPKSSQSSDFKSYQNNIEYPEEAEDKNIISVIVMKDCDVSDNTAFDGGGLYIEGQSIEIFVIRCYFYSDAFNRGGSLYLKGMEAGSINTYIQGCKFVSAVFTEGGNIYIQKAMVDIANSEFKAASMKGANIQAVEQCIINIKRSNFSLSVSWAGYINVEKSVIMNMEECQFDVLPWPTICIISTESCSITVLHSQFFLKYIPVPFPIALLDHTILFSIENNTNLTVIDSSFGPNLGLDLIVLSASNNATAKFIKCSFQKINGFVALHKTSVFMDNCTITDCIGTLQIDGLFEISDDSHLVMLNTNITHNNVLQANSLISIKIGSSLILSNCLYSRNQMPCHLLATQDSTISISNCEITHNIVIGSSNKPFKGILVIYSSTDKDHQAVNHRNNVNASKNQVSIEGSTISHNRVKGREVVSEWIYLMSISSIKNMNFCDTILTNNTADAVLNMASVDRNFNTFLQINNCTFNHNDADSIYTMNITGIIIHRSYFRRKNTQDHKFGIYIENALTSRIWTSTFNATGQAAQIAFVRGLGFLQTMHLFTLTSSFIHGKKVLQTNAKNFLHRATTQKFIHIRWLLNVTHKETKYASTVPMKCDSPVGYQCNCYFLLESRVNVYNCSSKTQVTLPYSVPNYTDWVWLPDNNIKQIHASIWYLHQIKFLNLEDNSITFISDSFLRDLNESETIKWLNLAGNNLISISKLIQNVTNLEKIWLSGNPFHCDCEMTWMVGWLNNFTTASKDHVIRDYQNVKCHSGKMKGFPIFTLDKVAMGCFPSTWTIWQKVGVGIGSGIGLIIISGLIVWIVKRSREFKFLMYYYLKLDTVPKYDKNENVDNMEYDAFFCYSHKDFKWISDVFWKNNGREFDMEIEHGFRLLIHDRDWIAGRTIRANIMDGIENSRRVIFIMSRFSMPHTPLRQLKPGGVKDPFDAFNFDDLSSDDEVPLPNERRNLRKKIDDREISRCAADVLLFSK